MVSIGNVVVEEEKEEKAPHSTETVMMGRSHRLELMTGHVYMEH